VAVLLKNGTILKKFNFRDLTCPDLK